MKAYRKSLAILLLLCLLPLAGCEDSGRQDVRIISMDTVMDLTAYGSNAQAGLSAATGVINALDAQLDPENPTSTVYAMNHAEGEAVRVSGQIAEMLQTAGTVYSRTGGALDLSVYPLVKAWGFVNGQYNVPSKDEISELLKRPKFSAVKLATFPDSDAVMATLPEGMELSFGSIAKGCASHYAIAAMRSSGVTSGIVSLGGNVQTLGKKPDGSNWSVAVQDPNNTGSAIGVLSVGETAIVTSGGYYRYFEGKDGERYHHILNPATGYPADSGLLSVTVICENGVMADALSTALFVLGERRAIEYYQTYGDFELVLVTSDGRIVLTNGLYDVFESYGDEYQVEYVGE